MKKIFFLLLLSSLLWSCKKNLFDYRNKFIGDYNFLVHKTAWSLSGPFIDTTYSYQGRIQIGSASDKIFINFSEITSMETYIYEDGTVSISFSPHQSLIGEFESTKALKFILSNNGLGGGSNYTVSGRKK